ncbi:MAG: tRNA (adenosine(37)-N6)-threonylcarbamoyltransferase complex ATPase subunit type 1 TsaE [Candidatus Paceibacterota bacterium]|jgi:tRNA threonylcarbamoyladenosine biosynthesis protein TsaE
MGQAKIISKSLNETAQAALTVLKNLKPNKSGATVLLLEGDLGGGKTSFTQALARELGIKNHLTSPTFVLMKSYKIPKEVTERLHLSVKNLVHIDAYRLNSGADLLNLGWVELSSNPDNLIVLEWPEKVVDLFDGSEHKIHFKFIDEQTREIIL